jgi:dGTPase
VEAIVLGHDVGHPPFGHIGEDVLDRCGRERFGRGFRHNEHSLRVVDVLERLNLTEPVRDGILRHSSGAGEPATLEGRIVRLVDRIAYINHDIDDALRAGVLSATDLPAEEIAVLGETGSRRIDMLVHDLVEHSEQAGDIVQGDVVGPAMLRLRAFMFQRVYLAPTARAEHAKIERVLHGLFEWYCEHPEELPAETVDGASEADRVIDYLAGMTDRFAIRAWTVRAVPQGLVG